jgi:hypothetical protein
VLCSFSESVLHLALSASRLCRSPSSTATRCREPSSSSLARSDSS